uniref:Uncharacterized protein n=1 Tax=Panagrolaimus davidi TaxID=227884 RepID=A0A914QEJ0_9BILA
MINNSQPSRTSINQLQPKKRARVKMLHPAAAATSSAGITEKPPTKKYKPRKTSTPAAATDYSHSSSEPPQSAPLTKNEKSGTPTRVVDFPGNRKKREISREFPGNFLGNFPMISRKRNFGNFAFFT